MSRTVLLSLLLSVVGLTFATSQTFVAQAQQSPKHILSTDDHAGPEDLLESVGYFANNMGRAQALERGLTDARERAHKEREQTGEPYVTVRVDFYETSNPESPFSIYDSRIGKSGVGSSADDATDSMITTAQVLTGAPEGSEFTNSITFIFGPNGGESVLSADAVNNAYSQSIARHTQPEAKPATKTSSSPASSTPTSEKWDQAQHTLSDPGATEKQKEQAGKDASDALDDAIRRANTAKCAPGGDCSACAQCSADPSARYLIRTTIFDRRVTNILRATHSFDLKAFATKGAKILSRP